MSPISTQSPLGQARIDAFAREHGQRLLRFAYLITGGDGPTAEDLVQTVLLRLTSRGIDDLDDPVSYARRAVVNEHISGGRRASALRRGLTRIGPTAEAVSESPEDRMAILSSLDVLTPRERAAIVLRYYEDLADPDIAAALDCSRVTVRSLVHRATKKLRRELAPSYERITEPDPTTEGGDDD